MSTVVEFGHRTQIVARFKRALLIFWVPLVLAALVPAIVTVVTSWFEGPVSTPLPSPLPTKDILSLISYLLFAVLAMVLFFGTVPLVVAIIIITNDKRRLDRLLNLFTEVFAASAKGIIDALKIFRRRDNPPGIPSKEAGSSPTRTTRTGRPSPGAKGATLTSGKK